MLRLEPMVQQWIAASRSVSQLVPARRVHPRRRPSLECLEARTVLSSITLTVNTLADDPSGPVPGLTSLRDVITQVNADTADQYVINFAVTGTIDLIDPLPALKNELSFQGPGASALTVQRDPSATPFSIFTVNTNVSVNLSGMSISGGAAVSGGGMYQGGGVYNSGTLTVTDCTFSNNSGFLAGGLVNRGTATVTGSIFTANSGADGGGINNDSGTLLVTDSTFSGNTGTLAGGLVNETTVTVTGCTFTDNIGQYNGGGFFNGGTATVTGCDFTNNSSLSCGGIFNENSIVVSDSTFTGNSASNGGGFSSDGNATVSDSTFMANSASSDGGGLYNDGTTLVVSGCTFTGNAAAYGGGLGNDNVPLMSSATVVNSTFTGNSATNNGGGLYNDGGGGYGSGGYYTFGGPLLLTNCTVSGNTSQSDGGGIDNNPYGAPVGQGSNTLTLNNTIVAGNSCATTIDNDLFGDLQPTSGFNLIGDGSGIINLDDLEQPAANNLIGTVADPMDPMLGPLASNGGPTQTMALVPGSPAIDAGSSALAIDPATQQTLAYDQRGAGSPRILGQSVDIGAYEYEPLGQTISFSTIADQTYGVAPITLNATATSGLPVSFALISGPATLSGSVLTITGAGDVVVEASQTGNTTYSATAAVDESFAVSPAPLTITAAADLSMVYGAMVPALSYTYTGLVNGDTSDPLSGGLTTTATSSSSVGTYPITLGTLAATGNYTIGTFNAGTLTVTPAPLTMTANNATKVYGAVLPALSASYVGFVNGDTASSLTTPPALTTTATASSPVQAGGYAITAAGASDPNYTISYQPGTLLITPARLTIAAIDASMVQGSAVPRLTVKYTGFVNGDSPASLSTLPTLSTTATSASSPGIYPILVRNAASPNYTINSLNGTLVVIPAPVSLQSVSIQSVRLGKSKKTTPVVVMRFSGALDPSAAENISSYSLTTVPKGKTQKSQTVRLSKALYNAATNVVMLITAKPLLLDSKLKLTCNTPRLLDSYGRPLSGDSVAMLRRK